MAARFPVSPTSVAYRIKAAWASKIHVIYWPAGADSLHRLRTGETATTIITRATSGATYNATEGRIEGNSTTYFQDSIAGGYGATREQDDYAVGVSLYADLFNSIGSAITHIGSVAPPDTFNDGLRLKSNNYTMDWGVKGASGMNVPGMGDNTLTQFGTAMRHFAADPTNRVRMWAAGAEVGSGSSYTPSGTALIGDTGRPLHIGGTKEGTGNTKVHFESAWFGVGSLSDADMVALTNDPSQIIEEFVVPSDASGDATADSGSVSGGATSIASSATGNVTADSGAVGGSAGPQPGTITSEPLYDNAGNLQASVALDYVSLYHPTTGALVVRKTGLSTNGAGVYTFSDAAVVQGVDYLHDWLTAGGARCMPAKAADA